MSQLYKSDLIQLCRDGRITYISKHGFVDIFCTIFGNKNMIGRLDLLSSNETSKFIFCDEKNKSIFHISLEELVNNGAREEK